MVLCVCMYICVYALYASEYIDSYKAWKEYDTKFQIMCLDVCASVLIGHIESKGRM
jgi:hypothetical protein